DFHVTGVQTCALPIFLAEYFKPGRIVKGYSGYDRVIEFHPSVPGEREWYVTVQAVRQDESGNWVNDPAYPWPRIHRTLPKPEELERVLGKLPKRGRVYRVDIPENDELMDWDAAFEDQPQAI